MVSPTRCEVILTDLRSTWRRFEQGNGTLRYVGKAIVGERFISGGSELYRLFEDLDVLDKHSVQAVLIHIDGCFSIIFEDEKGVLAVGDRVRSLPIFFAGNEKVVVISDSARAAKERCHLDEQNDVGVLEFLLCGYVTGNETLYKGLSQLLPGQYLLFDKGSGKVTVNDYFRYYPVRGERADLNREEKSEEYYMVMSRSFDRLRDLIVRENYRPVVPLSGGRDSRLMALLLKGQGLDNTICFTFGTEDHPEVVKSRQVAEALGFEWRFAPYTKDKWNQVYHSPTMAAYLEFAGGLSVRPHLLEFIAVKELFDGQDERYLFLPGHSLDFIAGSHIPWDLISLEAPGIRELCTSIFGKHFSFHYVYPGDRKAIIGRIRDALVGLPTVEKCDIIAAFECWDWRERQGKFILNSLNVYDFFGFEWYVPFWETPWMAFFMELPYQWRYKQNFQQIALNTLYPDYFDRTAWITEKREITREIISFVRRAPLMEGLIYTFNKMVRKRNYVSLSRNYGLERYGAFDTEPETLEEFARKYSRETDVKEIFYFFVFDYLVRNGFSLDFLNPGYRRVFSILPGH